MTPALERVALGAALLDRECPGWRDRVWPRTLDMMAVDQCLLGQVHGDYFHGATLLGLDGTAAREHGFLGHDSADDRALVAAWTATVRGAERRGPRAAVDRIFTFLGL